MSAWRPSLGSSACAAWSRRADRCGRLDGEQKLIRDAAAGDVLAVQQILKLSATPMRRALHRVLGPSHDEADDTLQQALIALVQSLGHFRGDCKLQSYAVRITINAAISTKKRAARRRRASA